MSCQYRSSRSLCSLQWRHDGHDSVSNHQSHDCLLNRLFRHRSKKTSKLRVTGLCVGNSPGTGEFPAQMASNAENVSILWRHHVLAPRTHHSPVRLVQGGGNSGFRGVKGSHIGRHTRGHFFQLCDRCIFLMGIPISGKMIFVSKRTPESNRFSH